MNPLKLTSWQRRRLRGELRTAPNARVYRRALAVLEFSQGRTVDEIARSLGVTRQSVYNWIDRYVAGRGPDTLEDRPRSGRPSCCTEELEAVLRYFVESSPQDWGHFDVGWTVPLLQNELLDATGYWLSEDTLRRELHRWGYVWKRPRYELQPDPEMEKKTTNSPKNTEFASTNRCSGRR
jgi:transposase